jgi:hypothetical protein
VRVVKYPVADAEAFREVAKGAKPYSVAEAVAKMQQLGVSCGITKAAALVLELALKAESSALASQDGPQTGDKVGATAQP